MPLAAQETCGLKIPCGWSDAIAKAADTATNKDRLMDASRLKWNERKAAQPPLHAPIA